MPKGYNADGTPRKPPGRKSAGKVQRGPYRFSPDVVAILDEQKNATVFLEDAAREKHNKDKPPPP